MTIDTIIVQLLALICNTYTAFAKKKNHIYVANMLFNVFCMIVGLLQQNYGLCLSYIVVIYRSYALLYKDRLKQRIPWFPVTFIGAHIILGIITWTDLWCLIPIVAPLLVGIVMWYSNNLQIYRWTNIVNNVLWMFHNMWSQSYILVLTRVYAAMVNLIALCKYRKKETLS